MLVTIVLFGVCFVVFCQPRCPTLEKVVEHTPYKSVRRDIKYGTQSSVKGRGPPVSGEQQGYAPHKVKHHIVALSCRKFSSNVVEKAVSYAQTEQIRGPLRKPIQPSTNENPTLEPRGTQWGIQKGEPNAEVFEKHGEINNKLVGACALVTR